MVHSLLELGRLVLIIREGFGGSMVVRMGLITLLIKLRMEMALVDTEF